MTSRTPAANLQITAGTVERHRPTAVYTFRFQRSDHVHLWYVHPPQLTVCWSVTNTHSQRPMLDTQPAGDTFVWSSRAVSR